ncbi:MAG: hypothetical protein DHS20C17_18810 [Cyclobacteriaceae bacterium]|nr:MAG: hypothetical protein DHS20C17_18810 [Cyclobacteriaceae bacterium]
MAVFNKSLLRRNTAKLLTENQSSGNTVDYPNARAIGILFTQTDRIKYQAIRNLVRQFKSDEKNVEVLCFLEKGGENYDFRYDYITSSDVGFWGNMQSSSALKFAGHRFDYLFYLDLKKNLYLENVMAMSNASCRIGFYKKQNDNLLDLMIQVKGGASIENAIDQIMYYTRKLGTNGS